MVSRSRAGRALVLVATASLVVSGCAANDNASSSEEESTLRLALGNSPASFDPAQMGDAGNMLQYAQAVYDSLLHKAPDGTIEPWLATDWEYNEDSTELTLTLRDDVTFADGTELTSEVVAANLEHFRDGGGPQASMLAEVEDVTTPDDYTVVIELSEPNPSLESYLTTVAGMQASAEGLDDPDLATEPAGSGPYEFDSGASTSGSMYAFSEREGYWNPDVVKFDNVEISVLTEPAAIANAFSSGQIDATSATVETLSQFDNAGAQIDAVEGDWSGFMIFDREGQLLEPLADVKVRQAFNYAIDREQVLETIQRDYGTLTTQIFSADDPAYMEELDEAYDYDPEKAKELLAEAGYEDGFDVTMPVFSFTPSDTLAVYAQQLAEVGINVTWEPQEVNTLMSTMTTGQSPINPMQFGAKGGWEIINQLVAPAVPNPLSNETEELNGLIEDVQFATDEDAEAEALQAVNTYVVEEAWFAPWFRIASPYASNPETVQVEMQSQQTIPSLYNFSPAE